MVVKIAQALGSDAYIWFSLYSLPAVQNGDNYGT